MKDALLRVSAHSDVRRRKASICAVAINAILAIALVGPAFAQAPTKIRINKIPIAGYVPVEYALSHGWFKEEGLDVSIDAVAAGGVAMQALIGGKLDIIYSGLDVPLRAKARGFDVNILSANNNAQKTPPDAGAILVRTDSEFQSLKNLEGKRFLVNALQNNNWSYSREAIRKALGNPDKVRFLELPIPQMVDALLGGQAEAASVTEPFTTIGIRSGKLKVASYMFVEAQPGLNIAGWVSTRTWVRDHMKQALAFRRILQRAMDALDKDQDEKSKTILKFTGLQPELLSQITLDRWTTTIDADDLQKQVELYTKQGLIDHTYDVKSMIVP